MVPCLEQTKEISRRGEGFGMRLIRLLLAVVGFAGAGYGQASCQQQCDNIQTVCTSNAFEQLNNCLANTGPCGKNMCSTGCPSGTTLLCDPKYPSAQNQCYSDYNTAIAVCDANYSDCSNACSQLVLPGASRRKLRKHPQKRSSDATWALLMRNLSRPSKLNLPL